MSFCPQKSSSFLASLGRDDAVDKTNEELLKRG